MPKLKIGDIAPNFEKTDQRGQPQILSELVKNGPVVVYFYPKDFTPGCTKQACLFRDAYEELKDVGLTQIVGVSMDGESQHKNFSERYTLPFPLLSDADKKLSNAYGVKGMMSLFSKRITFVVDQSQTIIGIFDFRLDMGAHIEAVKAALKALSV